MDPMKWNPFREMDDLQTRLSRMLGPRALQRTDEPSFGDWDPALDIHETGTEYAVIVDLPDVKKDDVKVELQDGVLTIEGERRFDKEEKGKKYHRVERQYGQFVRRFTVPTVVDPSKVQAEFKNGVLTVRLPKTAAPKPTTVDVKVA